ncbi:MAG: tetratricopeptide repeat protein [Chloroflexi bacterium]|nr:tetratricopeptide repeat protein [Chloroflexota bacterium]
MPDFDAMSQDELIAWLETLAKRQRDEAAESSPDYEADMDEAEAQLLPEAAGEEWTEWLEDDEALQQETPPTAEKPLQPEQELDDEDDDETPTALTTIGDSGSDDTTDPLTWLEDMATGAESGEIAASAELADLDEAPDHLADPESAAELGDPLDWLESLASEVSEAAEDIGQNVTAGTVEDNIDDAYEGDETFEDSEDESLYSQRAGESLAFPESLMGLDEPADEEFSTQSMAPLPDFLFPADDAPDGDLEPHLESESAPSAPAPYDSLTHAFLIQDRQAELEAWYAERLRAVAAPGDTAIQPTGTPASAPEALKMPPPGLRAGFKTARGKIAEGKVEAALADYETLLRADIGLDLVVTDLQWLIKQARHRDNPAVHRVLGDALMRQGQLQQALDVYRHALKLL